MSNDSNTDSAVSTLISVGSVVKNTYSAIRGLSVVISIDTELNSVQLLTDFGNIVKLSFKELDEEYSTTLIRCTDISQRFNDQLMLLKQALVEIGKTQAVNTCFTVINSHDILRLREEVLNTVDTLLTGIDCDNTEDDNGWWETSTGKDFGSAVKKKLKTELTNLINNLTTVR